VIFSCPAAYPGCNNQISYAAIFPEKKSYQQPLIYWRGHNSTFTPPHVAVRLVNDIGRHDAIIAGKALFSGMSSTVLTVTNPDCQCPRVKVKEDFVFGRA